MVEIVTATKEGAKHLFKVEAVAIKDFSVNDNMNKEEIGIVTDVVVSSI